MTNYHGIMVLGASQKRSQQFSQGTQTDRRQVRSVENVSNTRRAPVTTIVFPRIGIGLEEYRRNIVYRGWSKRRLVYFKLKTILTNNNNNIKSYSSSFVMKFRGYTKKKKLVLAAANLVINLALLSCSWFLVREQVRPETKTFICYVQINPGILYSQTFSSLS